MGRTMQELAIEGGRLTVTVDRTEREELEEAILRTERVMAAAQGHPEHALAIKELSRLLAAWAKLVKGQG